MSKSLLNQRYFQNYPPLPVPLNNLPITLALSIVVLAVFFVSQLVGVAIFAPHILAKGEQLTIPESVLMGSQNGTVIALAVIFTFFMVALTIWGFIRFKHRSVSEYLGLKAFGWKQFLVTGILLLLLNAVINVVSVWLKREPMMFMDTLVASAHPLWLLIGAMVFVAPIYEELMFRGFMWSGLAGSRMGVLGASILTSIAFTMIHGQYELIELCGIFFLAMLFSYARLISGSLLLPMVLHIINNGMAMAEYLTQ